MNYPSAIVIAAALLAIGFAGDAPSQATDHAASGHDRGYTLIRDRNVGTVWRMHVATGRLEACRAFDLFEEDASKVGGYCVLISN